MTNVTIPVFLHRVNGSKNNQHSALFFIQQRDKEAREARLLDFEIRRQQERDKKREEYKQQHPLEQPHEKSPPTTSGQQSQQHTTSGSNNTSSNPTPTIQTPPDRSCPPAFRSRSIERDILFERKRYSAPESAELKVFLH